VQICSMFLLASASENGKDEMQAVPIFEKDGNRLFVLAESFLGQSEEEARQIGLGASLVECVLMGMRFTGDVMSIDAPDGKFAIPHRRATLAGTTCCVIEGPLFDEANDQAHVPTGAERKEIT